MCYIQKHHKGPIETLSGMPGPSHGAGGIGPGEDMLIHEEAPDLDFLGFRV